MNDLYYRRAALLLTALLLSACGNHDLGTGPMRTETREVSDFDAIEVQGATMLEVAVGAPASLEVEGRDLFLKRLTTEVRNHTLYITSKKKDWVTIGTSPRLTIRIGVPKLTKLQLQGGNDARLNGFNGGSTSIRVEGATNLRGSGRLDQLSIFMAGAGNADLSSLVANSATVTVAGVGNISVHPEQSLDATMNGVGAIFYTGRPSQVNTHMNGLGTISQRDAKDTHAPSAADKPVDPNSLQPEYDDKQKAEDQKVEGKTTGVI
jgi:hypothetical protein